jgi:hypothetical protein
VSRIGDLAIAGAEKCEVHFLRLTQDFDWQEGDYGDSGSCYWGGRSAARTQILPDLGSWAALWHDSDGDGVARSWLVPWNGNMVLFNPYSRDDSVYSGVAQARILAFLWGESYREVELTANGEADGTLWINSRKGWAIGPAESLPSRVNFDVEEEEDFGCCERCHESFTYEDEGYMGPDGDLCEYCYNEYTCRCDDCQDTIWSDSVEERGDRNVCESCARDYAQCADCEEWFSPDDVEGADDDHEGGCCSECLEERIRDMWGRIREAHERYQFHLLDYEVYEVAA